MKHDILLDQNKDLEWWKEIFDLYAPHNTTVDQHRYEKLKALYGIINNDFTHIQAYLTNMDDPTAGLFSAKFPDLLKSVPIKYNRLYPKYEYHVNQIKNRINNHVVVPLDEGADEFKRNEFNDKVSKFVEKQMLAVQEIQSQVAQGQISQEDAQARIQEIQREEPPSYETFTSTLEQFFNGILEYFHYKYPEKQLKELGARHVLVSDDIYVGIVDKGEPHPVIFNPLRSSHHKSPDTMEVEKGARFIYSEYIAITDAYTEVLEHGTDDDLEKIKEWAGAYTSYSRPDKSWDITSGKAKFNLDYSSVAIARGMYGPNDPLIGQSMGVRGNQLIDNESLVKRTYLIIRAFDKVNVRTYVDEYNKTITDFVDLNYPIPDNAQTVITKDVYGRSIKRKEWVDEFGNPESIVTKIIARNYHAVRYDDLDIYLKMGEVPYQNFNPDELPIKGRMISSVNSEGISLVERGVSGLSQILFVKLLQNREMSKYKGVLENVDASQIPDYLAEDIDGKPLYEGVDKLAIYSYFQKTLGKSVSDSTYNKLGLPQQSKPKASNFEVSQAFAEIMNMQMFIDLLEREIGIQMLVPPQAEGIIQPYTTRGDNQEAQANAYVMASGYYDAVDEVFRKLKHEYIIQFVNYYRRYFEDNPDNTEVNLNYVTSDGTKKMLKIMPDYLDYTDVGLFIKDPQQNEDYRQLMQQYTLQALSQNRGEGAEQLSLITKALSRNESPEKIHKMIVIASRQQQDRAEKLQKQIEEIKLRAEQEKTRREQQLQAQEIQGKKDIEHIKGEYDIQEKSMDVYKMQDDLNKDQDGIPDPIEALVATRKLQQDDRKLDQQDRKLDIERQKLANDKQKNNVKQG